MRFGAGEPLEDPPQVRVLDAAPGVGHGEHHGRVLDPGADLDPVTGRGVRHGVLQQCVERHRDPVTVAEDGRLGHRAQPPVPGRVTPPVQRVHHHGLDRDRCQVQEVGTLRRGEQQHPGGQPAQPHQLIGHHPRVLGDDRVGDRPLDQLGVAEGHRDRGAEFVGGVLEEPALLLQQPQVLLGDPLHLLHGGKPFLGGGQQTMTRNISAISGTSAR